jgi:hypothetical protein
LLVNLFFLSSCEIVNEDTNGKAFYISAVSDINTQEPFHQIMLQKSEGLYKYDFWEKDSTFTKLDISQLNKGDTLLFENKEQLIYLEPYTLYEDLIMFYNDSHFFSYIKTTKGQEIKRKDFIDKVKGEHYSTKISNLKTPNSAFEIEEIISFLNGKLNYKWNYFYSDQLIYSETESVTFELYEVEDQLFIIPSTQDNSYPIYHIEYLDKEKLELSYFTDFKAKTKIYSKIESKSKVSDPNNYSLCNDHYQSIYYVGEDIRYSKGLEHLKNYLQSGMTEISGQGYINLHFTINCNGVVGRFGLELLDENYSPTDFDPSAIKHIVNKVSELKEWDNIDKISHRGAKDAKLFFLIKIKNQKITEVCP